MQLKDCDLNDVVWTSTVLKSYEKFAWLQSSHLAFQCIDKSSLTTLILNISGDR